MKGVNVLMATGETQGRRPNDFCWAREGELVMFPLGECDREEVDGRCGCRRSMAGLETHRATTTFKVVLFPLAPYTEAVKRLTELFRDALENGGWIRNGRIGQYPAADVIATDVAELLRVAGVYPVGTVLERRGEKIVARMRI